jgi:uroporphyrinogen decarboxylase
VHETLGYVFDAIKLTKEMLDDGTISGFAGSPWTIMCYAVEGQGSKSFDKAKGFCFSHPSSSRFVQKITDTTIYIYKKSKAGVDAVQVLILGAECCLQLIIKNSLGNTSIRLSKLWQIMLSNCFGKGCWFALNEMGKVVLLR